jgi:hypothetical protein
MSISDQDLTVKLLEPNKQDSQSILNSNNLVINKINKHLGTVESLYSTIINKKEPVKNYLETTLTEIKINVEDIISLVNHNKSEDLKIDVSLIF